MSDDWSKEKPNETGHWWFWRDDCGVRRALVISVRHDCVAHLDHPEEWNCGLESPRLRGGWWKRAGEDCPPPPPPAALPAWERVLRDFYKHREFTSVYFANIINAIKAEEQRDKEGRDEA